VAWEQFALRLAVPARPPLVLSHLPAVQLDEGGESLRVSGPGFEVVFSRSSGLITHYQVNGQALLCSGPLEKPTTARLPMLTC
jgi:hypothetical protein